MNAPQIQIYAIRTQASQGHTALDIVANHPFSAIAELSFSLQTISMMNVCLAGISTALAHQRRKASIPISITLILHVIVSIHSILASTIDVV
jgi:hypothetical protein